MPTEKFGAYEIVERIGQGSMGTVFRATDTRNGRTVALKVLSADMAAEDELVERFRREANAVAQLQHPNIIEVFDSAEEDGRLYMAMELLEGSDLTEVIRDGRLDTLSKKIDVMYQICDGMAFVHDVDVVHRDLKPANIHVQPGGRVKIMDFGLVRLVGSEMTRAGTVMGSPSYMSPEQMLGQPVTVRSDVFCLGSVFYEILTGQRAFGGKQIHTIMMAILKEEPKPIGELVRGVPPRLAALVRRALSKAPEARYENAGEMRDELDVMLKAARHLHR